MSETITQAALRHQEQRAQGTAMRSYGGTGGDGGMIIARFPGAGKPSPKLAAAIAAEARELDEANIASRMRLLNETRAAAIAALGWKAEPRSEAPRAKGEEPRVKPKKVRAWPLANLRGPVLIPCPAELEPLRERVRALMDRVGFVHNARRALGMDGTRWKGFLSGTLSMKFSTWQRLKQALPGVLEVAEASFNDPACVVTCGSAARLLPSATPEQLAELRAIIAPRMSRFGYQEHLRRLARVAKEVILTVLGTSPIEMRVNVSQWHRLMVAATSGQVEATLDEISARRKVWMRQKRPKAKEVVA